MNEQIDNSASQSLPDLQNTEMPPHKKYLKKVGVTNLELPFKVSRPGHEPINTVGKWSIYVDLKEHLKGINMSRINIAAHKAIDKAFGLDVIPEVLQQLKTDLESDNSFVKVRFTYFIKKKAPVTDFKGYVPYYCELSGELVDGVQRLFLTVTTVYTSLCPCSKEISDYSAHNQPSYGTTTVEIRPGEMITIEEIAQLVERCGSSEMYSILKRADEKFVTERAYNNPVFVEDMVRNVGAELDKLLDKTIVDYSFSTEHRESIHVSWATAVINAGRRLQ